MIGQSSVPIKFSSFRSFAAAELSRKIRDAAELMVVTPSFSSSDTTPVESD